MFSKRVLALFFWCHCHQLVLNPILQLIAIGLSGGGYYLPASGLRNGLLFGHSALYVAGSIVAEANKVALTPGNQLVLRCNIPEYPETKFAWSRRRIAPARSQSAQPEGADEEELRGADERFVITNNSLTIKSAHLADIADYYCKVINSGEEYVEKFTTIHVRTRPYIHEFELEGNTMLSAVVQQGKALKLVCNVVDDYSPDSNLTISWQMSKFDENDMNDVISGEDGIRIEFYNSTSQGIVIDEVTKDHRRFYKCQASNGFVSSSKVLLIRVKDSYRVLWPTVGIFIEIVILIGVICVVENRRVEPDRVNYNDPKAAQM